MRTWLLVGLLVCGCVPPFPSPMTAGQTVQLDSGPALVAYLAQPDASPTVCDLRAHGPHVSTMTPDIRKHIVEGLVNGRVEPLLWRRCIDALLKGLPSAEVPLLYGELGRAYRKILDDSDLEKGPPLVERLGTLHMLYLDRPIGFDAKASERAPLFAGLRTALAKGKLGPVAAYFVRDLIATLDVEQGQWQGKAVDVAMMDGLAAEGNEMTLTRFMERLPSAELREQARRRLLRIHIALSPFAEVRDGGTALEESVLRTGHNRIDLGAHPLQSASFGPQKPLVRGALVRQDVWKQTATLLGRADGRADLSVLPELSLRGVLSAKVQAIARPVGLCEHKKDLDPSPCISTADVSIDNPFAYLDKGGAFHFREHVGLRDVIPLARNTNFLLPLRIGGQPALTLKWGLSYERTENLVFSGRSAGNPGPRLKVRVERPTPARFVFTTSSAQRTYAAVVEAANVRDFRVASRGAGGLSGSSGSPGFPGTPGSTCSDGGPGGNGGPGGDGGAGGNGGDIEVEVACGGAPCLDTIALLRQIILSIAGSGGTGGSGGSGGAGGSGGSGRSPTTHLDSDNNLVTDDPGCSAGNNGSSGANGSDGVNGPDGRPGRVTFTVVP